MKPQNLSCWNASISKSPPSIWGESPIGNTANRINVSLGNHNDKIMSVREMRTEIIDTAKVTLTAIDV